VLEFVACASLLSLVLGLCASAFSLWRAQARAEDDARVLLRQAVLCDARTPRPTLLSVDGEAARAGATATFEPEGDALLRVRVVLPTGALVPGLGLLTWTPSATLVMRREPGC